MVDLVLAGQLAYLLQGVGGSFVHNCLETVGAISNGHGAVLAALYFIAHDGLRHHAGITVAVALGDTLLGLVAVAVVAAEESQKAG